MKNKGYLFITLAGLFWGLIGFFATGLSRQGFTAEQNGFIRLFLGFIFMSLYALFKSPKSLKLNKPTLIYSLEIGIVCQFLFNLSYFNAINKIGVSLAAILLYTSPIFVTIFSKIVYKETITKNKIISLCLCFLGATLSVTGNSLNFSSLNILGILLGLTASITYALMPIISKSALEKCDRLSILIYGFLFGAILMIPFSSPFKILTLLNNPKSIILAICIGLIPAFLAYICYISGIATGIELSKVGIISSIELVVSVLIGWIIFKESFSLLKFLGLFLMISSIIITSQDPTSTEKNQEDIPM